MSIRKKTLLIIISTLVILVGVLWGTAQSLVMGSFDKLEQRDAIKNTNRAQSALNQVLADMDTKASDWSAWDDTYNFVKDGNKGFVNSNITESAFSGMKLNTIIIIDTAGKIIYGQGFDSTTKKISPLPSDMQSHLVSTDPILQHSSPNDSHAGILMLKDGPLMLASRPIVNSSGKGPIRGSLIFARFLNADEVARLSDLTHLSLSVFPANDLTGLSTDQQVICKNLAPTKASVCPVDNKIIVGYSLSDDLYKKPAVVLSVNIPREIHTYGLAAMKYLLTSLALAVILFAVVMVLVIDRLVLVRIAQLNKFAHGALQQLGIE